MKVGFLAGTLGRGGAERQLIYMLQALKAEQIETRVLCLTKGEAFEQEIRELGVDVDWIGSTRNQFIRLRRIVQNVRERPVDILQSVHFYTNFYAAVAGRVSRVRNIGAIRNDLTSEIKANHIFGKWHLKLPQRLIANSQIAVDRAIAKGILPENIELVRNVVTGKSGEINLRSTDANSVRILFAGRLVPQKRPELFIEMASQLCERLFDVNLEFVIAGDGPLRSDLEHLAQKHNLENKGVKFAGETSEMSELYLSSDILVLTSDHEGTPNVILEAMAYGLPVVATTVGGVPGILNDRCGILVEPTNIEELVAAASKLIANRKLRLEMGIQGKEYVRKNHSIGYLQDRLKFIYSELIRTSIAKSESRSTSQ
ncbi:MAG: glycosyltransferase [Chloracidobacterium sp.]|nr:glycosyltransferase [Chloracidobacterium sp.]